MSFFPLRLPEKLRRRLARRMLPLLAPSLEPSPEDVVSITLFMLDMKEREAPHVLEIGSLAYEGQPADGRRSWVPHAGRFVGTDIEAGRGVDQVSDAHALTEVFEPESFDGVISASTLEHLRYPWLVAHEIAKVLKPGGLVFMHSVQTHGLHGYPDDYWRFSTSALRALFPRALGMEVMSCHYHLPCLIMTGNDPQQLQSQAYINTLLLARKVAPTPAEFPAREALKENLEAGEARETELRKKALSL